jgi:hypothetical protein
MTTRQTLHDEQIVDQLLREAGKEGATELKAALLELRCLAGGPPPVPSATLAALMASAPVSLDARRSGRHRRAIVALAIAASIGLSTAAVAAADPGMRENVQATLGPRINTVTHGNSGRPAPARTPDHPAPATGAPGRSGQGNAPSTAHGEGNPGLETRPSPNPGTPPAAATGGGGSAPTGVGNRPSPETSHSSPHSYTRPPSSRASWVRAVAGPTAMNL